MEYTPSHVALVRHAKRHDEYGGDEVTWETKKARPYDTPIFKSVNNFELIKQTATFLQKYECTTIITSPFTRCFETAVILALELNIDMIKIDNRLGEVMYKVKKYGVEELQYCSMEEFCNILKKMSDKDIKIVYTNNSNAPSVHETIDEFTKRTDMLISIVKEHNTDKKIHYHDGNKSNENTANLINGNSILVTHADFISSWLQKLNKNHVFAPKECGCVVLKTTNNDYVKIEDTLGIERIM
jgi:broad specificity phosphatase PhoE